jgi:hypothetical protein
MGIVVNVDNFCRAETNRMLAGLLARTGGLGVWLHDRELGSLDEQTVIRQNRDTLYSVALVDISSPATLTVPDAGDRYLSVMVVNQDHYINRVIHEAGDHVLTTDEFDTQYVVLAARVLADPADPADLDAVHALQDGFGVYTGPQTPFALPAYDEASFTATRQALLELARGLGGFDHAFGRRQAVDPVRHLIGTAAGWGGLPEQEAFYVNVEPRLPVGQYQLTVGEVPADAFWSISLYNAQGFFEPNERGVNNVNSVTADRNTDGTITVSFGGGGNDRPNRLPIMEGWNYLVRLYRPRPEVLDGTWTSRPSRGTSRQDPPTG